MKFRNPILFFVITTIFSVCLAMPTVAAEGNLGLSLQILQGDSSSSGIESNTRLWFVVEPGKSKSRTFIVKSTSAISEKITLSIDAVKRVNGQSQLAIGENSPIEGWVSFGTNDFVLAPKAIKGIVMTITVPVDEDINSFSAMLLVKASAVSDQESKDAYSVPGAAQIAAPIFLGVGTEDEFVTEFEIKDVFGVNTTEGKALRVEIKNNGKTPVSILGDVQVSGITFQTDTLGPFNYETETIAPGESKYADAIVGDQIVEGKWRIYITASQGAITETREFEKNIIYTGSNSLFPFLIRVAIGVISLLLLLWAYRAFRPRTVLRDGLSVNKKNKVSEATRVLIAELEAKTAALEAEVAKKSVRKKAASSVETKKPVISGGASKKPAAKRVVKKAVARKPEK
jgi:hypothetical protein